MAMAEATADSRAVAGAMRAENLLFQPMGAEATTREGAAVADKATSMVTPHHTKHYPCFQSKN